VKRHNRISSLTLELYHRDLATRKERRLVEKALKTDVKVQNRYKALVESEQEFRCLFAEELSRLNIQVTPQVPVVITGKTVGIILAIAAGLLCAIIPAFFYLKGKVSNKENLIAESSAAGSSVVSETETTEGFLFEYNDEIEGFEQVSYPVIENMAEAKQTGNTQKNGNTEKQSGGVTIAAVPETNTEIRTRGSNAVQQPVPPDEQSNLPIPPGLTSIFENMFANKLLVGIVIPDRITSIAKNAFAGNPLVSVTIGANVDVHDEAIPGNFAKAYNNYGRTAGIYIRPNSNSEEWGRGE
jgi:hypothetical protein